LRSWGSWGGGGSCGLFSMSSFPRRESRSEFGIRNSEFGMSARGGSRVA
jgi:hypothetical protein